MLSLYDPIETIANYYTSNSLIDQVQQSNQVYINDPLNSRINILALSPHAYQFDGAKPQVQNDSDGNTFVIWTMKYQLKVIFSGYDNKAVIDNSSLFYHYVREALISNGYNALITRVQWQNTTFLFNQSHYIIEWTSYPWLSLAYQYQITGGEVTGVSGLTIEMNADSTEINQRDFEVSNG